MSSVSARLLDVDIAAGGALEIACALAVARPAHRHRLLRPVRDFAEVKSTGQVTKGRGRRRAKMLDVDQIGLDCDGRKLLLAVLEKFGGGPVGIENWRPAIGEERRHHRGCARAVFLISRVSAAATAARMATVLTYRHFGAALLAGRRAATLWQEG